MRLASALLLLSTSALAAPRAFPFAWESSSLEPGATEVTAWVTPRLLRTNEDPFSRIEGRAGVMRGINSWLETMLAFDIDIETMGMIEQADARLTSLWHFTPTKATQALGLAAIARASMGLDSVELEARLIVDKRMGAVTIALNSAMTRSTFWQARGGIDTRLEQVGSLGYTLPLGVTVSAEARVRTAFAATRYQGTAVHVGPSLTYRGRGYWLAVAIATQVAADRAPEDRQLKEPMELRDNERFTGRLMLSVDVP